MDARRVLDFLPQRDERAAAVMELVPETERYKSFHVVEPSGAAHSTGAASIVTLTLLGRTSWIGRTLSALRLTRLMDAVYWLLARNRAFLGRFVRDAPGPVRWSDPS